MQWIVIAIVLFTNGMRHDYHSSTLYEDNYSCRSAIEQGIQDVAQQEHATDPDAEFEVRATCVLAEDVLGTEL